MATTSPDNIPYVGPSQYGEPADFPAIDEDQAQALQTIIATLRSSITAITSNTTGAAVVPVGTIVAYGGTTAPTGWHLCDGTAHGSTALTAVLGSANAPDLRDRFVVGAGSSYSRGNTGGADSVTLTSAQSGLVSHDHTASSGSESGNHAHWVDPPVTATSGHTADHSHGGTTGYMSQNSIHTHDAKLFEGHTADSGDSEQWLDSATVSQDNYIWDGVLVSNASVEHTHSFTTGGVSSDHAHSVDIAGFYSAGISAAHTHAVTVAASSSANATQAHENRPPFYALVYIIKK